MRIAPFHLILLTFSILSTGAVASTNLITNGSFEEVSPGALLVTGPLYTAATSPPQFHYGCGQGCGFYTGYIPGWASPDIIDRTNLILSDGVGFDNGPTGTSDFFNYMPNGQRALYGHTSTDATIGQYVNYTPHAGDSLTLTAQMGTGKQFGAPGCLFLSIVYPPVSVVNYETFDCGGYTGIPDSSFANSVNFLATGTSAGPGDWSTYSVTHIVTQGDVAAFAASNAPGISVQVFGFDFMMDNVVLTIEVPGPLLTVEVPEPRSMLLLAFGLFATGLSRYKRVFQFAVDHV